ncbi:MAG TPA: MerR family transcriptional regulator, partial [Casimicrobiaceae bacterium]|nr:MerR family transcriptional regulator [Casimicrobiaceae bacterium]
EGAFCISLGTETPLDEVRRAAIAHKAHVVALSFSGAYPLRQASDALATLRGELPPLTGLWAGGEMTRRLRKISPGISLITDLAAATVALKSWRAQSVHPGGPMRDEPGLA